MKPHTSQPTRRIPLALLAVFTVLLLTLFGGFALTHAEQAPPAEDENAISMLVYSRTVGYRHNSIEDGVKMLEKLSDEHGYMMTHTEDPAAFTDQSLAPYTVVVFLNTTKDVLDDTQQEAFIRYIRNGGAFVGIHAASDTEYDWPWFGKLVGAYFDGHPQIQQANVNITEPEHACTHGLPNPWTRTDEWYNFRDIQPGLTVLCKVDETTYEGGTNGENHPISWCQEFEGGRSFYTAMGHTRESYYEPLFIDHVHRGIQWAAGVEQE